MKILFVAAVCWPEAMLTSFNAWLRIVEELRDARSGLRRGSRRRISWQFGFLLSGGLI